MVPARHLIAGPPPPSAPSVRTTVIASAAAVGAVATGSLTMLLPAESTAPTAVADEAPTLGALSASSVAMLHNPATQAVGSLAPVAPDGFATADQHLAINSLVAQGGLDSCIAQALRILDMPQSLAPGVKKIIMAESGGNPHAINLTDSNARRGTPSQGLMQTIPSTFRHYVAPEVAGRPITDPVANITAGINYMVENYGINTVAAGGRSNSLGNYIGY
jgi:soluble lytic murein transglycosylase-like protein